MSEFLSVARTIMGPGYTVDDYLVWLEAQLTEGRALDPSLPVERDAPPPAHERAIPTTVYFVIEDRQYAYIGITQNLEQRITQHRARSPWCNDDVVFQVHSVERNREDALAVERRLIEDHQPRHNIYLTERDPRMKARS